MFHEGGTVCYEYAKQINLMGRHLGLFVQGSLYLFTFRKNVPSQLERSPLSNSLAIALRTIVQPV